MNERYSGPIDGRDTEEMDKILSDLKTATHGLPFSYKVVPFDLPTVVVYRDWEEGQDPIGTLMWSTDSLGEEIIYTWWTITYPGVRTMSHPDGLRIALAHLINHHVDTVVGLG